MKYIVLLVAVIVVLSAIGFYLLPKTDTQNKNSITNTPSKDEIAALEGQLNGTVPTENKATDSVPTAVEQKTGVSEIQASKVEEQQKEVMIPVLRMPEKKPDAPVKTIANKKYIEIVNPSGFVNTNNAPVTIGEYIGKKVILLNVLTYSCSNCQATFPYVNTWYDKYEDDGLIVIGLHTPEFAFEKDKANVEAAMLKFGIKYPIVMDNDYATWTAYGNRYWPRKYLIDIHGNIIYDHIGEGAYEETEAEILKALIERKNILDV